MTKQFPEGFIWGASTASYQIEGAAQEVVGALASGTPSAKPRGRLKMATPVMWPATIITVSRRISR